MYEADENFKAPLNQDQRIWRYMDFMKFGSLLCYNSLYLARADTLGDKFEGSLSHPTKEDYRKALEQIEQLEKHRKEAENDATADTKGPTELLNDFSKIFKGLVKTVGVSCWHMNDDESAAMWSLYTKTNQGIAIQSTYHKLFEEFKQREFAYKNWDGKLY